MKYILTAGIDEVGRGPLAGPVVAAAIILPVSFKVKGLRDSKQLTAKQREEWYSLFQKDPNIQWGIGKVSERIIDRINIYQATRLAMERAVKNLSKRKTPQFLLIDGNMRIQTLIPQKTIIKGDERTTLCAAASIIAKVTRDRLMKKYHAKYPNYGFHKHKGYGTPQHFLMLSSYGPCPLHRKTFLSSYAKKENLSTFG